MSTIKICILFYTLFVYIFQSYQRPIAHNVSAVYEVLGARIGKRKGIQSILTPPLRFQGA